VHKIAGKVHRFRDLRSADTIKKYIADDYVRKIVPREASLVATQVVESYVYELLDTLLERGDIALISESPAQERTGYAIITEHINNWTKVKEGFVYQLGVDEGNRSIEHQLAHLGNTRLIGEELGYQLLRAQISESDNSAPLRELMERSGWDTNALIPYRLLLPSVDPSVVDGYEFDDIDSGNIHVRPAQEKDYSFVVRLLAEAAWVALSDFEKANTTLQGLERNIHDEFEPLLHNGTCFSFIAESTRCGLCGHATIQIGDLHPLLGIVESDLLDVFVLPWVSGHGVGRYLTGKILAACAERGLHLIRGTVSVANTPAHRVQQVCSALERDGWWFSTRILCRYIGEGKP